MTEKLLERILKDIGKPELVEFLTDKISASDLQSLLLEVYRKRAGELSAADVFKQYKNNRFVKPAESDPLRMMDFDQLAFSLLPAAYQVLELSPVAPLGTNSVLAPVSQNNALTTIRNTEVCADSSNVLALEASNRRRILKEKNPKTADPVKLCASQRLLRTQQFDEPAAFAHFRLLSLCVAGRDKGGHQFELETLIEQLVYFIQLVEKSKNVGFSPANIRITINVRDQLILTRFDRKVTANMLGLPNASLKILFTEDENWNYYSNFRYHIFIKDKQGQEFFICDGGDTNWTQQLLSDHKERYIISGFGSERFCYCFDDN